jgi:hypothetical protein
MAKREAMQLEICSMSIGAGCLCAAPRRGEPAPSDKQGQSEATP